MLAPVALFVYNRADNTQKTIEALLANTLAKETDLYVFSDGGKDEKSWQKVNEVRLLLHQVKSEVETTKALKSITIVERPENLVCDSLCHFCFLYFSSVLAIACSSRSQ